MSVIIRGMEMPECCCKCDLLGYISYCALLRRTMLIENVLKGRDIDCPLEEVMEDDMR